MSDIIGKEITFNYDISKSKELITFFEGENVNSLYFSGFIVERYTGKDGNIHYLIDTTTYVDHNGGIHNSSLSLVIYPWEIYSFIRPVKIDLSKLDNLNENVKSYKLCDCENECKNIDNALVKCKKQ